MDQLLIWPELVGKLKLAIESNIFYNTLLISMALQGGRGWEHYPPLQIGLGGWACAPGAPCFCHLESCNFLASAQQLYRDSKWVHTKIVEQKWFHSVKFSKQIV